MKRVPFLSFLSCLWEEMGCDYQDRITDLDKPPSLESDLVKKDWAGDLGCRLGCANANTALWSLYLSVFLFIFIPINWATGNWEKGSHGQITQDSVVENSCHSMYIMQKWILKKRIKHKLAAGAGGEGSRWASGMTLKNILQIGNQGLKEEDLWLQGLISTPSRTSCLRAPMKLMVPGPGGKPQDSACQRKTAT